MRFVVNNRVATAHLKSTMTETEMRSQGRRRLADAFMKDALREATPWRSRADLAFEDLYLYALSSLDEHADDYEHPDAQALNTAAHKLELTLEQIEPALTYLAHRYDPTFPDNGHDYRVLIEIAKLFEAGH
jgi:hypothetical protein